MATVPWSLRKNAAPSNLLSLKSVSCAVISAAVCDTIIFDSEIFNQDIYVTYADSQGSTGEMNYYIELEQVNLDLNENTVATLKDIRNLS